MALILVSTTRPRSFLFSLKYDRILLAALSRESSFHMQNCGFRRPSVFVQLPIGVATLDAANGLSDHTMDGTQHVAVALKGAHLQPV